MVAAAAAATLVLHLTWIAVVAMARKQCGPAEERGRLRYAGVVFHEKVLRNSQQCFNLCWSTTPCQTVNFSFKTRKCSLMKTKHQRQTDLDVDFNNVYGVVSRPQCKSFRNPCDERPCNESFTCFGYDNKHTCVPAKPPRIRCPPPKPLSNARVHATGRWRKEVATYTCKKGFKFKGNSNSSVCTKHGLKGIWKGLDGKCIRLKCAQPVEIDNAVLMPGPTLAGSTRTYTCNNINQSVTVICHKNETWSTHHLHCPVDCGAPPNISNTVVSDGGTLEGSNRTYSCDNNTVPSGNPYTTCLTNSSWSQTDFMCKVDCGQPPTVPNANSTCNSTYLYGTATYECLRGYKATGVKEQRCMTNGHWSNYSFSCSKVDCGQPPTVPNANSTCNSTYLYGTATYECLRGYKATGVKEQRCMTNGHWSNYSFNCSKVQCVDIVDVEHAVHEGQGPWYSGDTLQLHCKDGFDASGNTQAFCGMDGTWLNVSLICSEALPRVLVAVKETGKFHIINVGTKETHELLFNSSRSVQDVDFCPHLQKLFWVEENVIRSANLDDATSEEVVRQKGIGGFVRVDGQKNFVFYAIRGNKTKLKRRKGTDIKVLIEVDAPLALEIDTQSELVYWAEWMTHKQIMRMKYDGTMVEPVIKLDRCDMGPWAVHIDENKRMYWSVNDEVRYSDYNQDHNNTLSQFSNICDSIKTFRDMVFVSCTNDTTVKLHANGTMQPPLSLNEQFSGEKFITIVP